MTDTTKITVSNHGKRAEGVRTTEGTLVWVQPGHQRTVTVFPAGLAGVKRLDFLKVDEHDAAPAPAPAASEAEDAKADADMVAALADPELVEAIDDADLRAFIERKSGQKPHHALGRAKLVETATALAA